MTKKDDLILENENLKRKLQAAEVWMQRQIHESYHMIRFDQNRKNSRKRFENLLEEDLLDTLQRRMDEYFGEKMSRSPEYTRERLMDAEIYWITLQKHPTIDAFPVIASYQKILDAFFEERITNGFRLRYENTNLPHPDKGLEQDIANIITREYTLSLGRWYQLLSMIYTSKMSGYYAGLLWGYVREVSPELLQILISSDFYLIFGELINLEVFGQKRHNKKISYTDARRVREILVGNYEKEGLLRMII